MKEILLSDGTKVRVVKRNGILEGIFGTKRVEIQFLDKCGKVEKTLLLYSRDIKKLFDSVEEM